MQRSPLFISLLGFKKKGGARLKNSNKKVEKKNLNQGITFLCNLKKAEPMGAASRPISKVSGQITSCIGSLN